MFKTMRFTVVLFLTIVNLSVNGQTKTISYSPDKKFHLLIVSSAQGDLNTKWEYWLVGNKDTTLLTTATTHDQYAPAFFWTKTSQALIFEGQNLDGSDNKIKIYNLRGKKIDFETRGLIWGLGQNHFDQDRGLIFYFKKTDQAAKRFNLIMLDISSKEIKDLTSVVTSGDPLTGTPDIVMINTVTKELTLSFETTEFRQKKRIVNY
jgi:hypothetical protein